MKNAIFLILVTVSFLSCFTEKQGRIQYFNDDYKNQKTILLKDYFKFEEKRVVPVTSIFCTFIREISDEKDFFYIETIIKRTVSSNMISDEAFIKIDDEKFDLKITERTITNRNEINEHTNESKTGDSTKVTITTSTSLTYSSYIEEKLKIELTEEQIEKIKFAKTLNLRFYSEPYPVTVLIKPVTINKLKQILSFKSDNYNNNFQSF
jgi:hypothetical protein